MRKQIYNPSLRLQKTKEGKAYLDRIRKMTPYARLIYWIKERHAIHCKRFGLPKSTVGSPDYKGIGPEHNSPFLPNAKETEPPWTEDPILKTIFFCNPYRENDKVTSYLRANFREEYKKDPCVFLGTILLRMFNHIPTMAKLINAGIPQELGTRKTGRKALDAMRDMLVDDRDNRDEQIFGGAYIIIFPPGQQKVEAAHQTMMGLLDSWHELKYYPMFENTLEDAANTLRGFYGMGQFYIYQYVGDLSFTHVLNKAKDWHTWGYCGPGTARGLYRLKGITEIKGVPLERRCPAPRDADEQLAALRTVVNKDLKGLPPIHMRDLCNCLCEYDKYNRALYNERHLKRPYSGE